MIPLVITALCVLGQTPTVKPDGAASPIYELRSYTAKPGGVWELCQLIKTSGLRTFRKHGITALGYWTPQENTHGRLVCLLQFASVGAHDQAWKDVAEDPDWVRAKRAANLGTAITHVTSIMLRATDYSPDIRPKRGAVPRLYELRTYVAAKGKLADLHKRIRNAEIRILRHHGIDSVGYWTPIPPEQGADDTLTFLVVHKSEQTARASWETFRADPEWKGVVEATDRDGKLIELPQKSTMLVPTDFSPMQ